MLPFAHDSFDLVASSWVLEHVARPVAFFREVGRVLRPGGWFVTVTPNGQHYATWIIRALRLLPHAVVQSLVYRCYGRAHHDTFPTYYRLNTPSALERAARVAGLELGRLVGFMNPDYFRFWDWLRTTASRVDNLLDRLRPGWGRLYLVACLRKPGAVYEMSATSKNGRAPAA
jgi:SAM-dependent methyltransferase